jgi:hypothetical protein
MSRYNYYLSQHFLNGNIEVIRKGKIFSKVVATYHHNDEGQALAAKHVEHLNRWFQDGWWSNATWL